MNPNRSRRSRREHSDTSVFPPPFGGGVSPDQPSSESARLSGRCTAVLGSMTQAMRAQEVLAYAAIRAQVVKISSSATHSGCAYGLEFPCNQAGNVRGVLGSAGIGIKNMLSS